MRLILRSFNTLHVCNAMTVIFRSLKTNYVVAMLKINLISTYTVQWYYIHFTHSITLSNFMNCGFIDTIVIVMWHQAPSSQETRYG